MKGMAAAGVVAAIHPHELFANPSRKQIGIQLYTIREQVNDDLQGSLRKLAQIGYSTIETAGYNNRKFYNYSPTDFKGLVANFGLTAMSSHSSLSPDTIGQAVDDTREAGMRYLVQPSLPAEKRKTADDYHQVAEELNKMGEVCSKAGITLAYHNHAFEFEKIDGQLPYDILLEETEPGLVTMQLDTYWMVYGGYDPVEYFRNFPGRFKLWHVKDMAKSDKKESTEIGSGQLDFISIFKERETAGLEHVFVEQEHFQMDPWESLNISFRYLQRLNF